jgi:hypothetical protein
MTTNPYEVGKLEPHEPRWPLTPEIWGWIVYVVLLSTMPLLWLLAVLSNVLAVK